MLTEQQRAELERHGFVVLDGDVLADLAAGRVFSIDGALPRAAEAAAILGIAPPGYRLVPDAVADYCAGDITEIAATMQAAREHKAMWFKLASALSPKEVETR